ncbi:transcription initiation factor IIB [Halobacteriales archaeon QS_1_68_20]|nr:MAG: transcription initiation factor IIB [Halobacteriales archaeon QS_1_68_20]
MSTTGARNCPECDGTLNASGDETICGECGLVVSVDRMDRGPEWRSFPDEETSRERTGAPLTRSRHDRGLSTEIGHHGDTLRLKGRKRRRIARLRRQHKRTTIGTKSERNQVYAFTEIRRLVSNLDLPESVRESACRLFESAQGEDLLRGRSLEGFAAAAVYATCRTRSISRTIEEITEAARASRDELQVAYDALNRDLGLPTGPIHPREYVPRFASQLDLPTPVAERARELAAEARERGIDNGRNPCGVAAACLYVAADECDVELTQGEAAEVADVTPVTLRSTYYDLTE